ncbi:MAG: P-loop NTPase [Kofleriaceae bacterium]|nr:P-loop NTPase [Kofleriaceae bacterium]
MSITKNPSSPAIVRRDMVTRLDNPITALRPAEAATLYGLDPTPPEIQLTPHNIEGQLDPRLALVLEPDSERSAAYRVLRHHVIAAARPQVIVVSSPNPGEGKTTVALNLALALAECGRAKVALVEAHVKRPQLSDIIGRLPAWCFGDQLVAHRSTPRLHWSLIDLATVGLHVAPLSPAIEKKQLVDGVAFTIAMEQLRLGGYDHIIVDTPPVLDSAEVNMMVDASDAILLVARARKSTARDLQRAIDQLATPKITGTVLVHA